MYPRLFHCHFHTCLSFSTLICGVERRSLLSCQQHSCNMTTPCCAIYTFPVNVSVCPSGLDPTAISSFCNMSHLLSSLLLMLPLIRQVVANPMFLSFFLRCFLVGFFFGFFGYFVSGVFPDDTMSLIISDPSHLLLTCFALPLRLSTTFCLSHFLLNALWALWACPYLFFYCHAEVTILRYLKSSPCKWFSSLIFSKYFHKGLTSFYSVFGIYLFFKMPCNFFFF